MKRLFASSRYRLLFKASSKNACFSLNNTKFDFNESQKGESNKNSSTTM